MRLCKNGHPWERGRSNRRCLACQREWRGNNDQYRASQGLCSKRWQAKNPVKMAWHRYRAAARARSIGFDLPRALVEDLVTDNCFYCGAKPNPTNGIDRVRNELGYTSDNVVSCCEKCNYGKSGMSANDFLKWATMVANHSECYPIVEEIQPCQQQLQSH
jgi:hypothetical protein